MSTTRRDQDFLLDIQEAIERVLDYTAGLTFETYLRDIKTQDAVVRNLEILGEATRHLSEDIQRTYAEIPWREMVGTRDRLTHHYFGINQEIVWQIVEQDLPELKLQIENLLQNYSI